MGRWADDPEQAADALIEGCLDELALQGRILLANQGGALPQAIAARGLAHAVWNRRLLGRYAAAPWPAPGPFDAALVRLPKARDEQLMTAHAAMSVLAPDGRLILYGGNSEGIRSTADMLENLARAEVVSTRGHGRVLAAQRPENLGTIRGTLESWRAVTPLTIAGVARDWVSYPGIFAAGRLDEGTALLLDALPPLGPRARVLDYGCGSGVIAAATLAQQPAIAVDALDSDAVALQAVRENVPAARPVLGARVADAGQIPYDAILSNPPLHQGIAEDHALLERLIGDAPACLLPGGMLQMVVQRRIPLDRLLAQHFATTRVVAENGRFRVWQARRA